MVCWRYASSRVVVAGLGRMGNAIGFRSRSCARTRRRQAHDYRRRAWLLRAGEIGSVEKSCGLPISHQTSHELARSDENAESVLPSITDSGEMLWRVRFVPNPDSCTAPNSERHSITLSALSRIESGNLVPSAFAALMLITNSNLVGCSMGRSAGFAPLRILST